MLFQTNHAFDPSAEHVSVGEQVFDVVKDASEQCGHLVVDAPQELGAVYGWAHAKVQKPAKADAKKGASKGD